MHKVTKSGVKGGRMEQEKGKMDKLYNVSKETTHIRLFYRA